MFNQILLLKMLIPSPYMSIVGSGGAVAGGSATVGAHNRMSAVVGSGGVVASGIATISKSTPLYDNISATINAVSINTVSGLITPPGYVWPDNSIDANLTTSVSAVSAEIQSYVLSGAITSPIGQVSGQLQAVYNLVGTVGAVRVSSMNSSILAGNALSVALANRTNKVSGFIGMGALLNGTLTSPVSQVSGTLSVREIVTTPEGICLVINTTNLARSEYTNFLPDSIVEFDGHYYGAFPDGIYSLEGETDGTTEIVTTLQTGQSDLGVDTIKNVDALYIAGKYDEVVVTGITDRETELYEVGGTSYNLLERNRVKLPRGPFSYYWGFKITGAKHIDSLELLFVASQRRISRS